MILQSKIIAQDNQKQINRLSLQSIVGKGYADFGIVNVDIEYVKVQEQVKI